MGAEAWEQTPLSQPELLGVSPFPATLNVTPERRNLELNAEDKVCK